MIVMQIIHPLYHPLKNKKPLKANAINGFRFLNVPQTGIEPVLALLQTGF